MASRGEGKYSRSTNEVIADCDLNARIENDYK